MRFAPAAVVAALMLASAPAQGAALTPGTIELNGNFVLDQGTLKYEVLGVEIEDTSFNIGLDAGIGYSITAPLQLGLGIGVSHTSVDNDLVEYSATVLGLTGDVTWNFATGANLIPFLRAGAGFQTYSGDLYDDTETTLILPFARAGVRAMVGEAASINVSVGYSRETNAAGISDADANRFNVRAGLSIFPVRGQ
jgi:hypothetical protein